MTTAIDGNRATMLEIAAGPWRAAIRPDIGGALAMLTLHDSDIMRAMPAGSANVLDAACFPLVPYCNRIRRGRFSAGGLPVTMPANLPPERHSIHGLGWQAPWRVEALFGASVEIAFDHPGGTDAADQEGGKGWPWPFRALQHFALDEKGLTITLTLTNHGLTEMPGGIGLHPYFRRWRDSKVRFAAARMLLCDVETLPTGETAAADHFAPWSQAALLPDLTVDHAFAQWDGAATIRDGLGTISLRADGAQHLHVYAPANGTVLCLEPVNHLPDAVNRSQWPMPMLGAGETARLTLRIEAE